MNYTQTRLNLIAIAFALPLGFGLTMPLLATERAAVPGPQTEVRALMGRPTFFLDQKPFTTPLFATYVPTQHYYEQMANIGCKLFNFQANCSSCDIGFSTPTWKGPDEWDFKQMDERARMILTADSNAMIFPRIYIGTPEWWRKENPSEMIVLDHGGTIYKEPCNPFMNVWLRSYPSLVSEKWRRDMGAALRKTIEHMQQSDYGKHIFGYEIAALGSEEWYHITVNQEQLGDYSVHMKRAFQKWVRDKYQTKQMLQAAWGRSGFDFDEVVIPNKQERMGDQEQTFRHPATDMNVIDFYVFYSEVVADTIDYFANIAKETSGRKKVVGAFYDYMYEFRGGPEFGHNAGGKLLQSTNIDFICAPPSYYERQLGTGVECYRRPFFSGTVNGKLWFHDNDLASFMFPRVMRRLKVPEETIRRYIAQIYPTLTAQESIWLYQRAAGFVLCEGIYESFFDLHGGYFDHPLLLNALRNVTQTLDRAKAHDRSSNAEMLIVADEASLAYTTFQSDYPPKAHSNRINEALLQHQIGFIKAGAPFDAVLLNDLVRVNLDQYKLVYFLNTYNINNAIRQMIDTKLKRNNRTLVWCYAPGLFNGNLESADLVHDLTGIKIEPATSEVFIEPKVTLTKLGQEWMEKLGEKPLTEPFGMDGNICRRFSVRDAEAEALGTLSGAKDVVMARKEMGQWTSVYSLTPVLTPDVVRTLARSAGVHIYSTSNDTFYANKSYITINGGIAGDKTIDLPFAADVYNALTEDILYENVTRIDTSLMVGETQIFRYQSAAKLNAH